LAFAALAAAPPSVLARAPAKTHRVGLLLSTSPPAAAHVVAAFTTALRDLGHREGENLVVEYRWAEGRLDRFGPLATELVNLGMDVIVASSSPAAEAARRATSAIPIVMVGVAEPVAGGLVASLVRPGGNVTGLSSQLTPDIRAKQLQLLKEVAPRARVGVLRNRAVATAAGWQDYETAGRAAGMTLLSLEVAGVDDLERAVRALARGRPAALFVPADPVFFTHRGRLVELATEHRLPAMFSFREFVEAGGLMAYSARLTDSFRRAAAYVDKILRGARPGDLPVEQPTQFELVINLRTARALGLAIPPELRVRADELIQ
jgi:putative ABC transport system substrate-binding protein